MSGDAGFRRYFRFIANNIHYIAVDSPVKYCNNHAFLAVGIGLNSQQINTPDVLFVDIGEGFFCLQDFGDQLLADSLSSDTMESLYRRAIEILPKVAATSQTMTMSTANLKSSDKPDSLSDYSLPDYSLPKYDRAFITTELGIFTQWLLDEYLNLSLSETESRELGRCFELLTNNALEQPQVTMHRDFHSRNLMILSNNELGVIDFQDAVVGPITYDIVSLLRDCYVRWPDDQVESLFEHFISLISPQLTETDITMHTWKRWFDLMGVQRHVKACGIFARLLLRDNKPHYIKDIPLTLSYIKDVCSDYKELEFLSAFVSDKVIPAVEARMA